jgi:hypothetical protein
MNILDQILSDLSEIKSQLANNSSTALVIDERLISREETCKLFVPEISRQTLANYTKTVPLKVYKIGGRLYYKQSEIIGAAVEMKAYKKGP